MKVVILAGGFGTRLSEYTHRIPKPMIEISGKPMLLHIMEIYRKFGFKEFVIALGYKGQLIRDYFLKKSDLPVNYPEDQIIKFLDLDIQLVDTGLETMTGGRLRRLRNLINQGTFLFTYGDGLANVNIKKLVKTHHESGKLVTVTAVHPIARFGELSIESSGKVRSFKEKPQIQEGWINGGFFVMEPQFLDYIESDKTLLEKEPLEKIAQIGELYAFKHEGFWHCMDSQRDKDRLEDLARQNNPPWK
ncbi:MAG: glucose-1-phosphate cytidylyltransferase [Gammaproteobacteria bacterium]|nr:glucose-1-phosphate cytidylyltransferase [Gammaproteobacteria bacterium]|tara:strand:- start:456 stop:1196 length:741 start_codon:yes stop_codon:yes gene_type:complete